MKAKVKETPATKEQSFLPVLNIETLYLTLIGDTPLICHRWSEKAKKEMLDKQMKKAKGAKTAKDPAQDYIDSLYWLSEKPENPTQKQIEKADFGFPAIAFKNAAVGACRHIDGMKMTISRGVFHITGDDNGLVKIVGSPNIREDMVRIGMGVADIRYRGEFKNWSVTLTVRYNKNVLSEEQIVNLFNTAGFAVGVGEWRPEKDGQNGMFHVATDKEFIERELADK